MENDLTILSLLLDNKQESAISSSVKAAEERKKKNKQRAILASKLLGMSNKRISNLVAFLYENCPAAVTFDDYTTSKSRENRLNIIVEKIDEKTFEKVYQNANDPSVKLEVKTLSYQNEQIPRNASGLPPPIRTYKIRDIRQFDAETGDTIAIHAGVSAVSRATGVNRSTVYSILDHRRTTRDGWSLEYDSDPSSNRPKPSRGKKRASSQKWRAPRRKKTKTSPGTSGGARYPVAITEVDIETQKVVRRFETMSSAARFHKCGLSVIQKALRGGDINLGGITFRASTRHPKQQAGDDSMEDSDSPADASSGDEESSASEVTPPPRVARGRKGHNSVPVAECDAKTGKIRKIFPSMTAAAEAVGIDRKRVRRIMEGSLKTPDWNGLTWKIVPKQQCVAACNAKTGSIQKIFRSRTQAVETLGIPRVILNSVLDGQAPSWNGTSFKYCASDESVAEEDESSADESASDDTESSEGEESKVDGDESFSSASKPVSSTGPRRKKSARVHHLSHKTTEIDVKTGAVRNIYSSRSEAVRKTGVSWSIFRKIYSGELSEWKGVAWRLHRSDDDDNESRRETKRAKAETDEARMGLKEATVEKRERSSKETAVEKRERRSRAATVENLKRRSEEATVENLKRSSKEATVGNSKRSSKQGTAENRKRSSPDKSKQNQSPFYHPAVPVAECDAWTGAVRNVFKSMSEASKKSGASRHAVKRALDGEEPSVWKGLTWRYLTADEVSSTAAPSTMATEAVQADSTGTTKDDELVPGRF